MKEVFRLLINEARSAAANMAVDEFLMAACAKNKSKSSFRFYTWASPSASIGYFESVEDVARRLHARDKKMAVVRRMSGGGTVLHGNDLTFSIAMPAANDFFSTDVKSSYLKINEALRYGLRDIYPLLEFADCKTVPSGRGSKSRECFEMPACYDLLLQGKKVVGASQRRIDGVILHQSAIFLDSPKESLIQKILKGFEKVWDISFEPKSLDNEEWEEIKAIELRRYGNQDWALLPH